jgi:hypothetical protein
LRSLVKIERQASSAGRRRGRDNGHRACCTAASEIEAARVNALVARAQIAAAVSQAVTTKYLDDLAEQRLQATPSRRSGIPWLRRRLRVGEQQVVLASRAIARWSRNIISINGREARRVFR